MRPVLDLRARLRGGLWGLLVGDALGVPYEFHAPEQLPERAALEMVPPAGFQRSHSRVPPGTWSDDGAQALALLDALLTCGHLDVADLGSRLVDWYQRGRYAVDNLVFDCGIQTSAALQRIVQGEPAVTAGARHERANGNGALMRVLPLALWHTGTDAELVRDAARQGRPTHGHRRSEICCALYCLWARRIVQGAADPWAEAVVSTRALCTEPGDAAELAIIDPDQLGGSGSGYVVDSLRSAHTVVAGERSYEATVRAAIALGNDTDTTACIAGGIAGLIYGFEGIPARWTDMLRGGTILRPLEARLLDHLP